jgi:hypothetical protein
MKIKQVYIPYWEWEDWINGMWGKSENESEQLKQAIEFTGDCVKYGEAMKEVVKAWPRTMLNSLTNSGINKRAFLGHCAVCYKLNIPEYITRIAWKELTDQQRYDADKVAQKTVEDWIKNYEAEDKTIHKPLAKSLLF